MKILTKEVWNSNEIFKMTLMLKILMTKITITFSLYIVCTNHEEYEKQFLKTKKVLCDFKQFEIFA